MNKKIDLSVIVVSYNTRDLLVDTLESLKSANNVLELEIIVVDNNSQDDSVEAVERMAKQGLPIKIIQNKKNRGFGAANNQGMEIASSEFILLLNSDTIVNKQAIIDCLDYIRSMDDVGVLGCKLVEEDGKVQRNGGFFPSFTNVFFWMTLLDDIKIFYKHIKPYHTNPKFEKDRIRELDWVTGAFFLIRKKVFDEVGGFDEDYFMYVEEMDYCYRIKSKDWKVVYFPKASIIHLGGGSGSSKNALINEFDGLKRFYRKHRSGDLLVSILLSLGSLIRIILFFILGDQRRSKIYVEALRKI